MCLVALPLLRYWPSFSKVQACSWNDNRFWLDISAEGDEGGKGGFGSVSTNRALIPRPWCYFLEALVRVPNNCLCYLHTKECRESVGTQKRVGFSKRDSNIFHPNIAETREPQKLTKSKIAIVATGKSTVALLPHRKNVTKCLFVFLALFTWRTQKTDALQ